MRRRAAYSIFITLVVSPLLLIGCGDSESKNGTGGMANLDGAGTAGATGGAMNYDGGGAGGAKLDVGASDSSTGGADAAVTSSGGAAGSKGGSTGTKAIPPECSTTSCIPPTPGALALSCDYQSTIAKGGMVYAYGDLKSGNNVCIDQGAACITGTTQAQVIGDTTIWGSGIGIALNQPNGGGGGTAATVIPTGTGLTYSVSSVPTQGLLIELMPSGLCANVAAASGTIPWTRFVANCGDYAPGGDTSQVSVGTFQPSSGISAVQFQVPAVAIAGSYSFCVNSISFSDSSGSDGGTTPAACNSTLVTPDGGNSVTVGTTWSGFAFTGHDTSGSVSPTTGTSLGSTSCSSSKCYDADASAFPGFGAVPCTADWGSLIGTPSCTGSTISPTCTATGCTPAFDGSMSGVVAQSGNSSGYAQMGWSVNGTTGTWTVPATGSVTVNFTSNVTPMRFEVADANGHSWCAPLTSGKPIPWSSFVLDCWQTGGTSLPAGTAIQQALVQVYGNNAAALWYDVCIESITIQ